MSRHQSRSRSRAGSTPPSRRPHFFADSHWLPVPTTSHILRPLRRRQAIRIYTWNIDFQRSHTVSRINGALDHLSDHLPSTAPLPPTVILLQELRDESLAALLSHPWVRSNFQVSHIVPPARSSYFTLILVSLPLHVAQVLRVPFLESRMARDVLFTDIMMEDGEVLRVGSTHLESLPIGEAQRPVQLRTIASYLREPGVVAGVVGGDMNAISANDVDLPLRDDIALDDAWELEPFKGRGGGSYGLAYGHTWGYQPLSRFPPGRLDKILYTGKVGFVCLEGESLLRRIGVNVMFKVRPEDEDANYLPSEKSKWVSDHFGLTATMMIG